MRSLLIFTFLFAAVGSLLSLPMVFAGSIVAGIPYTIGVTANSLFGRTKNRGSVSKKMLNWVNRTKEGLQVLFGLMMVSLYMLWMLLLGVGEVGLPKAS